MVRNGTNNVRKGDILTCISNVDYYGNKHNVVIGDTYKVFDFAYNEYTYSFCYGVLNSKGEVCYVPTYMLENTKEVRDDVITDILSDKEVYTSDEVISIIKVLVNKPNYLESIRTGGNSIKSWLKDFNKGVFDKFKK